MEVDNDNVEIIDEVTENEHPSEESDSDDGDDDLDSEKEEALRLRVEKLRSQIAENPLYYDGHVNLIAALRELMELEDARQAREAMNIVYPLSPELWLDWVRDEQKICSTKEERNYIITLFDRAVKDYTSVQVWVEYVMFMLGGGDMEATRAVGDRALTAVGTHVAEGVLVWQVVLLVEKQVYAGMQKPGAIDSEEDKKNLEKQLHRIQNLYRRQARVPLLNSDPQNLIDEALEYFGGEIENHMNIDIEKAQKKLSEKTSFEDQLLKCDNAVEKLAIYRQYIAHTHETDNPAAEQSLYERAVTDYCLDASLWEEYVQFTIRQFKGLDYVVLPVCERSQRNCPWSASLCVLHIRALQLFATEGDADLSKKVKGALEKGLNCGLQSGSEATRMWMSYLVYLRRVIPWEKEHNKELEALREAAQQAIDMIDESFGFDADIDSDIPRFWSRIEAECAKNMEKAREIWNEIIMKRNNNFKNVQMWLEFITLERSYGTEKHCRKLFRRALERVWDQIELIGDNYQRFEEEVGTLETMEDFIKRYEDRMVIVKRKRAEDAAKLEAEKESEATRFLKHKDRGKKFEKKTHFDKQANGHSQGDGVFKVPLQVPKRPKVVSKQAYSQSDVETPAQQSKSSGDVPQNSAKNSVTPPPGFKADAGGISPGVKADIEPPPGFKADVEPPPGFKAEVEPPPGFKAEVEPPPGFKAGIEPPPGFKRKLEESEAETLAKKTKVGEEYGIITETDTDDALCTVFISNLDFSSDKKDIIPLFSKCGEIKDFRLVRDFKLRSKGYGYLVFKTQNAMKKALELDRILLNSRPVFVSKYDPGGQNLNFKYTTTLEKQKLFVRGLPFDMTPDDVKEAFLPHGEIKELRLVSYRNGYSKGTCYIEYHTEEAAEKVRQAMDGKELKGKVISVMVSNPPSKDKLTNQKPSVKEVNLGSGGSKGKSTPGIRKKGMFDLMPRSLMRASHSTKDDQIVEEAPATKPKSNEDFRKLFLK